MTNRERYQKTFGALHASRDTVLEVTAMKNSKLKFHLSRCVAAAACTVALMAGTAFAANEATDGALSNYIRCFINGVEYQVKITDDNVYKTTTNDGASEILITGEFQDENGEAVDMQNAGDLSINTSGDDASVTFEEKDNVAAGSFSVAITDLEDDSGTGSSTEATGSAEASETE